MSIVRYRLLTLVALLGVTWATVIIWPIGNHNWVGLQMLHCLGDSGSIWPAQPNSTPCASLVREFIEGEAKGSSNGMVQNLELFAKMDKFPEHRDIYAIPAPVTLPEYEFLRALKAASIKDWIQSQENFERAVTCCSQSWLPDFYNHYRATLAQITPGVAAQLAQEDQSPPSALALIKAGRKEQPSWDMPVDVANGWQLDGLTVLGQRALDYGFPVHVNLFWEKDGLSDFRQTLAVENMIPNGGFELGKRWVTAGGIAGWYVGTMGEAEMHMVSHDGGVSTILMLSPGGADHSPLLDTNFIPIESHTNFLLWSAWLDRSGKGNPMVFVLWFDRQRKFLRFEIPFQGPVVGDVGRHYAGVIQVPPDAAYLQVKLHNWQASGEALFDDLFLMPLDLPVP